MRSGPVGLSLALLLTFALTPIAARGDVPPFAETLRNGFKERLSAHTVRYIDLEDPRAQVAVAPRFVWVRDLSLSLPGAPWIDERPFLEAFDLARTVWEQTDQPSDIKALAVFVTFDVGPTAPFYIALANDVEGIGERLFDDTPGSELDGLIWMGELDGLWEAGREYYEEAFIHEVAHRWSVYVDVDHPTLPTDALRGRQDRHWSFFADTDNSPMDGNDWKVDGTSVESQFLTPHVPVFSPLDRYLMGHAAPEDIPPFQVVRSHTRAEPSWVSVAPDTLPAHRLDVTVRLEGAQLETVTIEQIVAAEGPRVPARGPDEWPIGVVLLSSGFAGAASLDDRGRFDVMLAELQRRYETATGGAMQLQLRTAGAGTARAGGACDVNLDCDPSWSDGCDPTRGVCAAACRRAEDCEDNAGCCDGWCAPVAVCPRLEQTPDAGPPDGPAFGVDAEPADPGEDAGPQTEPREPSSCGARAVAVDTAAPWGVLAVAWLVGRLRRRGGDAR